MPELQKFIDLNYTLLFVFFIVIVLFLMIIGYIIKKKAEHTGVDNLILSLLTSLKIPFILTISMVILSLLIRDLIVAYTPNDSLLINLSSNITYITITIIVTFYSMKALNLIDSYYKKKYAGLQTALDMFRTIAKIIVVSIAGLIILENMGVNISRILAVGGIGGIALGLASKDLFANFFGFFVIILDRPFKVGDLISSTDKDIRGTVESISWRITKVINLEKRPIYIPNSLFTTIIVQNETRFIARRIKERIKFLYKNREDISIFITKVRDYLSNYSELVKNLDQLINLVKIGDSIAEFELILFVKTKENNEFLKVKEQILLKIAEISEECKLEGILPDTSVSITRNIKKT